MKITVEVPSNIAFLKYWGKEPNAEQWPLNSSLSMTLSKAKTITSFEASTDDAFYLNGKLLNQYEGAKIYAYLNRLRDKSLWKTRVPKTPLKIHSENSFPMGAGIASSASGYGALALGMYAFSISQSPTLEDLRRIGYIARLGSGSAGRSLLGGFVEWERGLTPSEQKISQVRPADWLLCDIILLVSKDEKSVSSSLGHELASTSPLLAPRLAKIPARLRAMKEAIADRNLQKLGPLIEEDSDEMHRVMETSSTPLVYRTLHTCELMAFIQDFRAKAGAQVYYTIDAGPNVHAILDERSVEIFLAEIRRSFPRLEYIRDHVGAGPQIIKGDGSRCDTAGGGFLDGLFVKGDL